MKPVKEAFLKSYTSGVSGKNQFTKVKINYKAHLVLGKYFQEQLSAIENNWFEIITPYNATIKELKTDLKNLAAKK